MRPLGMPDIFLAVGSEDTAVIGDEVCGIIEESCLVGACMLLDQSPRDQADFELLCEGSVVGQVSC